MLSFLLPLAERPQGPIIPCKPLVATGHDSHMCAQPLILTIVPFVLGTLSTPSLSTHLG